MKARKCIVCGQVDDALHTCPPGAKWYYDRGKVHGYTQMAVFTAMVLLWKWVL